LVALKKVQFVSLTYLPRRDEMANETRLELIAQVAKKLQQERNQSDEVDEKELGDRNEFTFEPHIIKLNRDEL